MEGNLFMPLKLSYDRLDEEKKNCFLYGALYPKEVEISASQLIQHWRMEGFIETWMNLAEAHDKGHQILNYLVGASLLERIGNGEHVKMHNLVRDMALGITSPEGEGCRFLVRAGLGIKEPPNEKEWEKAVRISFMANELCELPQMPHCPMLSTLLLQGNPNIYRIPKSFFEHMCALRVLDLSQTSIVSIPPSIKKLVSLRGLYLNDCVNLTNIPPEIGQLNVLEVLNLQHCPLIEHLPVEIGELSCLRSLDVPFTYQNFTDVFGDFDDEEQLTRVVTIHSDRLSKLSLLEHLGIVMFNIDKDCDINCLETVIEVLESFKQLTWLYLDFPKVELAENFIRRSAAWKDGCLRAFEFLVTDHGNFKQLYDIIHRSSLRVGRILRFVSVDGIPPVIIEVLNRAEYFLLQLHRTIKKLSDFGLKNMNRLKGCDIVQCDQLEIVIHVDDKSESGGALLPNLEALHIADVPNLKSLWKGPVPPGSLECLRILELYRCLELRKLFSRDMIQQLSNLEELIVCSCKIERLIDEEDMVDYDMFPKLKKVELFDLAELVGVCEMVLAWPSLEYINVIGCPNLDRLPLGIHNAATLLAIEAEEEWWEELEWEDETIKQHIQPLVRYRYNYYEQYSPSP